MLVKKFLSSTVVMVGVLCVALLVQPAQAYAWWRGGWGWGWHRPLAAVGITLGATAVALWAGGHQYYYDNGVYYNNTPQGYVVVSAPPGAVISTMPNGYAPYVVNGGTYYTRDGVYYQNTSRGYMVVSQPVTVVQVR